MAKIIDCFPKMIVCKIPEIIMLMIPNSKILFLFTGLLFFGLIFSLHSWFRDLLRELDKKYEVLLIIFFLVFLLFLVSEGLLFVSFFWTSFHSLSSPTLGSWPEEGFYLPDPLMMRKEKERCSVTRYKLP